MRSGRDDDLVKDALGQQLAVGGDVERAAARNDQPPQIGVAVAQRGEQMLDRILMDLLHRGRQIHMALLGFGIRRAARAEMALYLVGEDAL